MTEVRVPKLSNNDSEYLLTEWIAEHGKPIAVGDPVATVETSKAAEELAAEEAGYLSQLVPVGSTVTPGQLIATVSQTAPSAEAPAPVRLPESDGAGVSGAVGTSDVVITGPARTLMEELGIKEERVVALGIKVVRRTDIAELAAAVPTQPLSRVQQAVGRAVSESHATIPAAYTAMKMDIGRSLAEAAALSKEVKRPVGLTEIFVRAVAGLHDRFPLIFAALDGDRARLADVAHIGVTMDLGEGLYVPVVRDAAQLGVKELASQLMRFRLAAVEGNFRAEDLDGANFTVTLHTDPDVTLAIPFVFPGQVCALAVTAPQREPVLDEAGALTTRTVAAIGLAYDHRLINGRDAAAFLTALKEDLL
ncbi:catalytic domain of components of various dehydrogenase complexes [Catenulispora acidiphila DSM 44928]|uniref:Dihydrolipoamide acetyltransferase component of pyruvate dehydrogenase complex n=1 Tax=Catenulispora acidiphila (strain DSM 44928 / JCM 14897 / NBRC 102108 / NRRL B-24433 / ID139908) TaxID=479433 RepID=C7Q4X9_CATAD|nr:2-oxo acid dehydrogenase subunit E2 [Catenulispora acidiphila]ACU73927.1 catalytic domain of components of various dehydrogenase complexes [Catenulispora acidiphila DSM 44928]